MPRLIGLSDDGLSGWLDGRLYLICISTYWMSGWVSGWMGGGLGGSADEVWS